MPLEPVLRTRDLRALEAAHADAPLMARAGAAAADVAVRLTERAGRIVVLAGPGNNGGDALVTARLLRQRFFDVCVVMRADAARLPPDAAAAWRRYLDEGGSTAADPPAGRVALAIDGLFGIGLTRAPDAAHAALIDWINAVAAPRLALDVPSGIDADTGRALGTAVVATATATFLAWKPGLLTGPGVDHAGDTSLHDLGIAAGANRGDRLDWTGMAAALPAALRRQARSVHKGSFGTLALVGGAPGMVGAALLAGRGALAAGAGKVQVGLLANGPEVDFGCPELMLRSTAAALDGADAIVAGPGLGQSEAATLLLADVLVRPVPLALDADALNLVAQSDALREQVRARREPTLLTPHPAEAARLLATSTAKVQDDRVAAALSLAEALHAHVVLKGAGSVLADPAGRFAINASGNPGLATGGTGDVLAGIVGAMLAQRIAPADALRIAVCVHGAAADFLVARGTGPVGMRASELPDAVRALLNGAAVAP
jgi:ADP-dependent NAD(P)H-hydrate dehydratase / NAD(P)H-hydrate epimerase